jgi:hypothetical protein
VPVWEEEVAAVEEVAEVVVAVAAVVVAVAAVEEAVLVLQSADSRERHKAMHRSRRQSQRLFLHSCAYPRLLDVR